MWNISDTGWIKASLGSLFSPWLMGSCVFVHRMAQFDTDTVLDVSDNFYLQISLSIPHLPPNPEK